MTPTEHLAADKKISLDGWTVTISPPSGPLLFAHYKCVRDSDGAVALDGGSSRANHPDGKRGDVAHEKEILRTCRIFIAEFLKKEAKP